MSNIENFAKAIEIEMHATLSASLLAKSARISSLIILMGPPKAGKSTLIDFLAGRSLIHQLDEELDVMKVVEQTNRSSNYPLVYVMEAVSGGESTILLESITLGQDMEELAQSNLVKSLMVKEAVRMFGRVSVVLVVEEMRKDELELLAGQLLEWTGAEHEGFEEILAHCYLCLTKTEDCDMDEVLQNLKAMSQDYENPKVKALVQLLATPERVVEFKNAKPSAHQAQQILEKLMPTEITPAFRDSVKSQNATADITLGELEQRELFQTSAKAIKILSTLIAYLMDTDTDKKVLQKNYEHSVKQLFNGKQKMDIRKMVKKIAPGLLATANPNKTTAKNCQQILAAVCLEASNLLKNLKDESDSKEEMEELIGVLTFCGKFAPWVKKEGLEKESKTLSDLYMSCFKFLEEPKKAAEKKGEKQKRVKQTPFSLFKAALQPCKTNEEAMEVCIRAIKQKEKEANMDWRDVVYYLRLLRDLLKTYEHNGSRQSIFVQQLLELYLYTQDYYDYEETIVDYLRYGAVSFSTLTSLIRKLDSLKRYDCCLRCINYGIANTPDDDVFQLFLKLKGRILAKVHQEHMSRSNDTGDSNERKRQALNLSVQNIANILTDDDSGFLTGNHFQRLLGGLV